MASQKSADKHGAVACGGNIADIIGIVAYGS